VRTPTPPIGHPEVMVEDSDIATHEDPAWRDRTNYIVRLDLTPHELPGKWEQIWTRTDDQKSFEICCIPFFLYGVSLGDTLRIDLEHGTYVVGNKSGHRTIRLAFTDDAAAHREHDRVHDALVGRLGCAVEFRAGRHYAAIDIVTSEQAAAVIEVLTPLARADHLIWEWADPVQQD
jgi:hypothetical protein